MYMLDASNREFNWKSDVYVSDMMYVSYLRAVSRSNACSNGVRRGFRDEQEDVYVCVCTQVHHIYTNIVKWSMWPLGIIN